MTLTTTPTTERILEGCHRLMARYGFRKMSMDDLAEECGMSKRTIYTYFSSKTEVGLASIGSVIEATHEKLRETAQADLDADEQLRLVLHERIRGRIDRVQAYSTSLDELFEVVRTPYMDLRERYHIIEKGILTEILAKGVRQGSLVCDSPEETAETLLKATNAFIPHSLSVEQLGRPEKIYSDLNSMINLLLRGLKP